jgi:hypothetical protein
MTGGTTNHNKIPGNFYAYLRYALRGKDYDIYIADVRLWLPRYQQIRISYNEVCQNYG